jgi:diguanylate cyclase (GGDEF)-like protein
MVWSGIKPWRVPVTYGMAIASAVVCSAVVIGMLFASISKLESALPRFGFFAIREFHIAISEVTHLRDTISIAELAPRSTESLARLSATNDLIYVRFDRMDGGALHDIPAYPGIVLQVNDVVARLDAIIAAGLPLDEESLEQTAIKVDRIDERLNEEYYKYGEQVNVELYAAEKSLNRFNYQIAFALTVLSLLAIGTAVLLIGRRETIRKLEFLAWRDATTNLNNRAWMSANGPALLERARLAGKQLRLFLIDLDHFKDVNDTFGHHIGDMLLRKVAETLEAVERPDEVVAVRLGGDEFAVMAIGDKDSPADGIGRHLREQLNRFVEMESHQVRIGASIGMAYFPDHGSDVSTLLRNADTALYAAKAEGRSGLVTFSPAILSQIDRQLGEEAGIKRALNCDEFFLVWQPQFELATGRMTGAEALVRWRDTVSGLVRSPIAFIPMAERSDLILEIDKIVLSKACAQAVRWMPVSVDDFICAVNVSGKSFQNDAFFAHLVEVLERTGLPPSRLQLEITEGVFIEHSGDALNMLTKIRDIGVSLALDDFGSGYSSFRYLADLNFDRLKIDRSFLNDLESSAKKQDVVRGIIALANSLGLAVVAEGVETEGQLAFLIAEQCHSAQGFFMSKPIEQELLTNHLIAQQGNLRAKDRFKLKLIA